MLSEAKSYQTRWRTRMQTVYDLSPKHTHTGRKDRGFPVFQSD